MSLSRRVFGWLFGGEGGEGGEEGEGEAEGFEKVVGTVRFLLDRGGVVLVEGGGEEGMFFFFLNSLDA